MGDAADQADQVCELNLKLALASHEQAQHDAGQIRVDSEVYCVDCDEVVDAARVKALPQCVRCIACQELWELELRVCR